MCEYTQGVCGDGAAILKDGVPMTVEEILAELRRALYMEALIRNVVISAFGRVVCHDVAGKNWWDARDTVL